MLGSRFCGRMTTSIGKNSSPSSGIHLSSNRYLFYKRTAQGPQDNPRWISCHWPMWCKGTHSSRTPVFPSIRIVHWQIHKFTRYRVDNQYADPLKYEINKKIGIQSSKSAFSRRRLQLVGSPISNLRVISSQCSQAIVFWNQFHEVTSFGPCYFDRYIQSFNKTTRMNARWTGLASSHGCLQHRPVIIASHIDSIR